MIGDFPDEETIRKNYLRHTSMTTLKEEIRTLKKQIVKYEKKKVEILKDGIFSDDLEYGNAQGNVQRSTYAIEECEAEIRRRQEIIKKSDNAFNKWWEKMHREKWSDDMNLAKAAWDASMKHHKVLKSFEYLE